MPTLSELVSKLKGAPPPLPEPGVPAPSSSIPWWCWDQAGFKDCHALAFQAAQGECAAGGLTNDPTCLTTHADALAKARCGCAATPPPGAKDPDAPPMALIVGLVVVGAVVLMWPSSPKKKEAA